MSDSDSKQLVCVVNLTVETATATIDITTSDGMLFVDADSLAGIRELYRLQQSVNSTMGAWLPQLSETGEAVEIRVPVVVRVDSTPIVRYDPTAKSRLSTLLGVPLQPDIGGIVRTGVREIRRKLG